MENTFKKDMLYELSGLLQQCIRCGHATKYDPYNNICEKCGEGNLDIFFKCPECGGITDYGHTRCTDCRKKISDLISEQNNVPVVKRGIKFLNFKLWK
jgi:hypothetical protein